MDKKCLHVLLLCQHLDQLFDGPFPAYRYLQGLPAANRTVLTSLVLERI